MALYQNSFDNSKNLNEWKEAILYALKNLVKRSTLSDVPLACGLSGGLDSVNCWNIIQGKKIKYLFDGI